MKLLIIDDEKSIRNTLKDILEFEGHEVHLASDGVEGLAMATSDNYEVIFSDIKMPNMDGLEATRIIHELSPETPVIMQSAYAFAEDKERAAEAGCIDFLVKPVTKQALMDMIAKYL